MGSKIKSNVLNSSARKFFKSSTLSSLSNSLSPTIKKDNNATSSKDNNATSSKDNNTKSLLPAHKPSLSINANVEQAPSYSSSFNPTKKANDNVNNNNKTLSLSTTLSAFAPFNSTIKQMKNYTATPDIN